jgi:hypothetical protein
MTEQEAIEQMKRATDNLMTMARKIAEQKGYTLEEVLNEEKEREELCGKGVSKQKICTENSSR